MIGMSAGIRKLCVAYDVESYSGRGTQGEYAAQARLAELLRYAFLEVGAAPEACENQEQGDGGIAFLPTGGDVDEPRLIVNLIGALRTGLAELNADIVDQARIRLRVGLHQGVVHRAPHGYVGPAVIEVCRLRDADAVRAALAGAAAQLVVVVAESLYHDVLSQGYHGLTPSAFERVQVQAKNFSATAWLYVPEAPAAAGPGDAGPGDAGQGQAGNAAESGPDSGSVLESFLTTQPDTW